MFKKCFTIQSEKGSKYKVVVEYKNNKPKIYIGGSRYYCISVEGFILDVKSGDKCHDLYINNVNFSHKATDMMKALLYFIRIKQKEIGYHVDEECEITFTDSSENQFCGNLSSYYIAFYKKTWYEKDFGAYLINSTKNLLTPREKNQLQIPEKYMKNNIFDVVNMYKDYKKMLDDESYHTSEIKIAIKTYITSSILNPKIIENILSIYNTSLTIYDFFTKIKNTFSNKCKELNLSLWLDKFIKFTLGFAFLKNQTWKIDCNLIIDNQIYEIKNCNNLPEKYLLVNQTGNGQKKELTPRQRESYENQDWIGWNEINPNEYTRKDKLFLKKFK